MSLFTKAVKAEAKLRLAISGPSGSGKTYTALNVAQHLTDKPVALVDTEHGSASKYADLFSFDVLQLDPPYHPDRFLEAIRDATKAGYGVVILDSLTHAWNGTGGLLDIVDEIAKKDRNSNSFAAWKKATPIQNGLIDGLLGSDIHIIATMRSKQDYVQDKDDNGKTVIKKMGMNPIQRDGMEYEMDVFMEMDIDNNGVISKSRCVPLNGKIIAKPGKPLAETLKTWLTGEKVEKKAPVTRGEPEQVVTPETNGAKGKDLLKPASWPKVWLEQLTHLKYADNDFEAAGMLSKSDGTVSPSKPLTPVLIGAWGKAYRGERDLGAEPKEAAEVADKKLYDYLYPPTSNEEAGLDPRDGMPFGDK